MTTPPLRVLVMTDDEWHTLRDASSRQYARAAVEYEGQFCEDYKRVHRGLCSAIGTSHEGLREAVLMSLDNLYARHPEALERAAEGLREDVI